MELTFEAFSEARPGAKWQALFQRYWPAYRQWFLARGGASGPDLETARARLREYMPELSGTYDRLVELSGGDELAARFLTCYRPPTYLVSCSQAALSKPGHNILVRNYDLDPKLNEGLILHSAWNGRRVIATSEFLWGVADGMNDAGLALSLAFGGSKKVGDGFGIPLILRYVLEVCDNVGDAVSVLRRVPSHMAYNITLLDRSGAATTVQVAPDQPATIVQVPAATNHQSTVEWAEHARFTATLQREQVLHERLADERTTAQDLIGAFARKPLYNTDYRNGFGTLYTAVYYPEQNRVEWRWPDLTWTQTFADFRETSRLVRYSAAGARAGETVTDNTAYTYPQQDDYTTKDLAAILTQALQPLRQILTAGEQPLPTGWQKLFAELEQTGRIPWEKFGRLWTHVYGGYPDSCAGVCG
jgi:predicted choloylglycine hydrolase